MPIKAPASSPTEPRAVTSACSMLRSSSAVPEAVVTVANSASRFLQSATQ